MAYAVKRLVGPTWPYARLATLPSCSLPGRRPYWHGPAGSRWQSQSRAQAPSWLYALPDYSPHHAVCPVAVPTPCTQPPGSSRPSCQRAPCSRFDSDDSDAPPHSPRSPHGRQARTPIVVVLVQHLILQKRPYDRGATSTPWGRTTGGPPRRHGPPYRSRRPYRPPASPSTEGTLRNEHGAGGEGQPQPPRCSPSGDTTGSNPPEQLNFLQSNSRERGKVV